MSIATGKFRIILFGLNQVLRHTARKYPEFRARLAEHDVIAQMLARDEEVGRWFQIKGGALTSGAGVHPRPDITIAFKNARLAAELLTPPFNWLNQINAQKDFTMTVEGDDGLLNWFAQTVMLTQSIGADMGIPQADGSIR